MITTIEDRAIQKEYRIRSRHVIACDGAKSAVRKHLSITSEGEEASQFTMNSQMHASQMGGDILIIINSRNYDDDSYQC